MAEPEKKEIKTFEQINEEISKIDKKEKKIEIIKPFLGDKDYSKIRKKLVQIYVPIVLSTKEKPDFTLTYDSLSESLEPVYFWMLDFMRDAPPGGLGLQVVKGKEEYEASVASGYFGEIGQRMTMMQKQAAEYMGAINQVIKSIINLIYDLKEFETRIAMYDKLKSENQNEKAEGSYGLKGTWMDQVDIRKGKGSINMLAQDLNFITVRDAFFHIGSADDLNKLDLNDRVKNVLKRKWGEYQDWLKLSEKEIRNRFNVEKSYLKSQVGTLKLYASWVKPYLVAANKLKMSEFKTADIVASFSNMEIKLNLRGWKSFSADAVSPIFAQYNNAIPKQYFMIDIEMVFRSVPSAMQGQGGRHYVHGGRTDIFFKSYGPFEEAEIKAIQDFELYEDMRLVEEYVEPSLNAIQEDLDRFLSDKKDEKKEDKKAKEPPKFFEGFDNPFKGTFSGLGGAFDPVKALFKSEPPENEIKKQLADKTKEKADDTCKLIYDMYKRTHGMLAR